MTIKRPLVWAAGAMALGELASFWQPAAAAGIIFSLFCIIRGSGAWRFLLPLLCFFGGFLAWEAKLPSPEEQFLRSPGSHYVRAEGEVCGISLKEDTYTIRLEHCTVLADETVFAAESIQVRTEEPVGYGMIIAVSGQLEEFSAPRNPGEFDYGLYCRSLKLRSVMNADAVEVIRGEVSPLPQALYVLRNRAAEILASICGEEEAGLLAAMILGDKGQMDPEIRELYQDGGIAHLIAISGLHASLVGMSIYSVMRFLGVGFWGSGLAAGFFLFCYGSMAGFGASVFRAVIMLLCRFLAGCLGRTYDALSAMALAAVLLLADSPYLLLQSGFQLSFGAILAIAGVSEVLRQGLPGSGMGTDSRMANGIRDGLIVGASVQLVTCPIILYHFYQYPPYGFFLNFLVIPAMTYVVFSGILGIFAGAVSLTAGELCVGSAHYILGFYRWLLELAERLPGSLLVWGRPERWELTVYYGALAVLLWGLSVRSRREKSGGAGQAGGSGRVVGANQVGGSGRAGRLDRVGGSGQGGGSDGAGGSGQTGRSVRPLAALGLFCLLGVCLLRPSAPNRASVTFLDVGQGDGSLIRTPSCTILVDGGSSQIRELGSYRLEPFLKSQAVSRIDYAVVSHGDSDHISGLTYLLEECGEIGIDRLILPDYDRDGEAYSRLAELAETRGTDVFYMKAGDRLNEEDLTLLCLHPSAGFTKRDINEQSLVFRLECRGLSLLFTGDIELGGERWLTGGGSSELLKADILKAAHHGSDTSSSQAFLEAVRPKAAVLSFGAGNSYGHPSPEVVDRMEDMGVMLWKTAERGAVTVRETADGWVMDGFIRD